ncbi:MAG: hypothetical protein LBS60_09220 [Deltaproteobacteria bacterium]|jgi:hypothetical protein|nr:hypothetical protein [Deltaproteobacteria bacterium]
MSDILGSSILGLIVLSLGLFLVFADPSTAIPGSYEKMNATEQSLFSRLWSGLREALAKLESGIGLTSPANDLSLSESPNPPDKELTNAQGSLSPASLKVEMRRVEPPIIAVAE